MHVYTLPYTMLLNFSHRRTSRTLPMLSKNFTNVVQMFWKLKLCSGISNLISKPTNRCTSDVAIETSKTTAIQSKENIFHGHYENVIFDQLLLPVNPQKITLVTFWKKFWTKNRNKDIIIMSQININSVRDKVELS